MMPATIPSARNNPTPKAQPIEDVQFLKALHDCFGGADDETFSVDFEVKHQGPELVRTTRIMQNGAIVRESSATPIRRS